MKYHLYNKLSPTDGAEVYDNPDQLIVRLWGAHLQEYMLFVVDRPEKPNLLLDFSLSPSPDERLRMTAYVQEGSSSGTILYNDFLPFGDDIDKLVEIIKELELK